MSKIDKIISYFRSLNEDGVPTNSLSNGGIAGTSQAGDQPPVRKKRKKYISAGIGSRKLWMNYFKNK